MIFLYLSCSPIHFSLIPISGCDMLFLGKIYDYFSLSRMNDGLFVQTI